MANIYDIAREAGVSIATVSRVLNNHPRVSDATRQAVLAAMAALDYTPNAFARSLGLNTMKTVGLLCADISDPYFANAVYHFEGNLRSRGYHSILSCTGFDLEDRQDCLRTLLSRQVDALVMLGSSFLEEQRPRMEYIDKAAERVPVIMINSHYDHDNVFCVESDDFGMVRRTVIGLAASGKRKIHFLLGRRTPSVKEKLRGFKAGLRASGLAFSGDLLIVCADEIEKARDMLLAGRRVDADAVIACSDILAIGFLKYARLAGLAVPEECSVIGYSNSLLATSCEPELSSVDNHAENLCLAAVANLMQIFSGGTPPSRTIIACDLRTRRTTDAGFAV